MATFKGRYFSIIFIGKQNPQILNHDFLVKHNILPENKEPFQTLFANSESNPFSEFISTPVLTSLKYGPIIITIEENRYQIVDNSFDEPLSSPIIEITKKYFGNILRYTPFIVGGFNFKGILKFDDLKDEESFDNNLGVDRNRIRNLLDENDVRMGLTLSYPWNNGIIEINLPKAKERLKPGEINFNYEFNYKNIDDFIKRLDDLPLVYEKFINFIESFDIR